MSQSDANYTCNLSMNKESDDVRQRGMGSTGHERKTNNYIKARKHTVDC